MSQSGRNDLWAEEIAQEALEELRDDFPEIEMEFDTALMIVRRAMHALQRRGELEEKP